MVDDTVISLRAMDREELEMVIAGLDGVVEHWQESVGHADQLEKSILLRAYYKDLLEFHNRIYGG